MRTERSRSCTRVAQCAAAHGPMVVGGLGDLAVDAEQRVQRGHRILQDHRDHPPADAAHLARGFLRQVLALEGDATAGDAGGIRQQAHDREAGRGLAAARLADQAKRLAFVEGEADAVNRLDDALAAEAGEVRVQVGDFEQWGHCVTPPPLAGGGRERARLTPRSRPFAHAPHRITDRITNSAAAGRGGCAASHRTAASPAPPA